MTTAWVSALPPADQQRILSRARYVRYLRGETIHREGEPPTAMHLLVHGHVALKVDGRIGERTTVGVLGPADAVGLEALRPGNSTRMATAAALEPVEAWRLPVDLIAEIVSDHPSLLGAGLDLLIDRLALVTRWLADARTRTAEERVALRLCDVAAVYPGGNGHDGRASPADTPGIRVHLTQRELAEVAGTTRPTVSRALARAEAQGLVRTSRGDVWVLDVDGLRAMGR